MSTLKVNTVESASTPTVNIADGLSISGVSTFTGGVQVGTAATIKTNGNATFSGIVTSTEYRGGGSSGITIDSNGNVTKPASFHILVNRNGNQTGYNASSTSDPIVWNRVIEGSTGASSHFNTSTGLFTAPVTGMYLFHAAVNAGFTNEGAWLIINGSRVNYSAFNPNAAATSDGMVTYSVTAGQTVGIKWYKNGDTNATINANDLHTWWRIILLG